MLAFPGQIPETTGTNWKYTLNGMPVHPRAMATPTYTATGNLVYILASGRWEEILKPSGNTYRHKHKTHRQ